MRVYSIKVNGKKYKVEVMGVSEVSPTPVTQAAAPAAVKQEAPAAAPAAAPASAGGKEILAPMQGTILDVKVSVGSTVAVGDTVAILEAMKLENEVKSQVAGKVIEVKVSKGTQVNSKQVIIVVE